jgi:hypothetical protein
MESAGRKAVRDIEIGDWIDLEGDLIVLLGLDDDEIQHAWWNYEFAEVTEVDEYPTHISLTFHNGDIINFPSEHIVKTELPS